MLSVELLGELRLEIDGRELAVPDGRRTRILIAWLALHPGRHGRSRLAGAPRPEESEEAARHGLRRDLWALRKVLGEHPDAYLASTRQEVGFTSVEVGVGMLALRLAEGDEEAVKALGFRTILPGFDDDWIAEATATAASKASRDPCLAGGSCQGSVERAECPARSSPSR